jgi:nucleotide-binding universal stress UspA family protein
MGSTVIVGFDALEGSDDPFELGLWMADAAGADTLVIAYVFPRGRYDDVMRDSLLAAAKRAEKRLGEHRVGFDAIEAESPAHGLHELAEREQASLVVVGSSKRGPIGRLLAGNIAQRLLSGAACPVAVAPRGYAERADQHTGVVAVAYDGRAESREALEAARRLARRAGARLRLVAIVDPDPLGRPRTVSSIGTDVATEWPVDLHETYAQLLAEAAQAVGGEVEVETAVLDGNPVELLAEEHVDTLFCGSRGYGLLGQVLLGGTTARLVEKASSPVVVVPRSARRGLFG